MGTLCARSAICPRNVAKGCPLKFSAKKVLVSLLFVIAGLLALHLLFQYLNLERYHEKQGQIFEISNRVDFDDEASLPTWFTQFLLLSVGLSSLLAAVMESKKGAKRLWGFLGVSAILFSIDEVGGIHEFVLQSVHLLYYGEVVPTAALNAWWLALPFIAAAGLGVMVWLVRTLPKRTWLLFMASGIVYLAGAAGFELVSNDVAKTSFLYQGVMTGVEEVLEMVGVALGFYAVLDYLASYRGDRLARAWTTLRRS